MLENFKKGFGIAVGASIGYATVRVVADKILAAGANDDNYMEWLKTRNPKLYEETLEYRTEKDEEET